MKAVRNRREDLAGNIRRTAGKDGNRDDSDSGVRSGRKLDLPYEEIIKM